MVQGSLNANITFLCEKKCDLQLDTKKYQCYMRKKSKNAYKKRKDMSHVPKITQPKNQVPRLNGVPCSPFTDRQTDRATTESPLSLSLAQYHRAYVNTNRNNSFDSSYDNKPYIEQLLVFGFDPLGARQRNKTLNKI